MGSSENSAELLKAQALIWNQKFSFNNSACLKCAVQLGIPDVLHSHAKPMTLSQLTSALPINPAKAPFIYRLVRVLVNAGLFLEQEISLGGVQDEKGYSLTSAGRLLLKDEPFNLRALIQMTFDIENIKPWTTLSDWFQNDDDTPFKTAHGKKMWNFFAEKPRLQNLFNEGMARDSELIAKVLVEDCRFAFEGLTDLVDVGGGTGMVARAIVKAFPGLKCCVLDLPQAIAGQQGTGTLEFVQGDMLLEIPQANAVMLKWILHNWSDEDCIKILKNCKRAISNREGGGKLMIIEIVMGIPDAMDDYESAKAQIALDMCMLHYFSAKERSEKEWATLFQAAGFTKYKVYPVMGVRCLIEVFP